MKVLHILSSRERVQAPRSRLDGFPADIRRPGPADLRSTNSPSAGRRSSRGIQPRCSRAGWLDSLSTWGVECRGGHLSVSTGGAAPKRTTDACYVGATGGVTCGSSRY